MLTKLGFCGTLEVKTVVMVCLFEVCAFDINLVDTIHTCRSFGNPETRWTVDLEEL